jgi:hypothetical protein
MLDSCVDSCVVMVFTLVAAADMSCDHKQLVFQPSLQHSTAQQAAA